MVRKNYPKDIVKAVGITTVTLFRPESEVDRVRAKLALNSLEEASSIGYNVYVVDGGSYEEFLKDAEKRAHIYHKPKETFGNRTRYGIRQAYDNKHLVLMRMEIEKPLMSQVEKMVKPILEDKVDFIVPNRGNLFTSYPEIQAHFETGCNLIFKQLTGIKLDMWGGTRVWKRELSDYFLDETIDQEYSNPGGIPNNWACYFIPVIRIINNRELRVQGVDIDFQYPKEVANLEGQDYDFSVKRTTQSYLICSALKREWENINPKGLTHVTY